jgi:hypothetical protein
LSTSTEELPPSDSYTGAIKSDNSIHFFGPSDICNINDSTYVEVPIQYVLPPILGFIAICGIIFFFIWLKLKRIQRIEMKGKMWTSGPRSPEQMALDAQGSLQQEAEWSRKLRGMLFKEEPKKKRSRRNKKGKVGVEGGNDDGSSGSEYDDSSSSGGEEEIGGDARDLEKGVVKKSTDSEGMTTSSSLTVDKKKKRHGNKMHSASSKSKSKKSNKGAISNLFSRKSKKDSAGSTHSNSSDASDASDSDRSYTNPQTMRGAQIVTLYDSEDEDNNPNPQKHAILRIRNEGPPDRHTGGSSRWQPPHPLGTRHRVLVNYFATDRDEVTIRRGETVAVERWFEDGWVLVRVIETLEMLQQQQEERQAKAAVEAVKTAERNGEIVIEKEKKVPGSVTMMNQMSAWKDKLAKGNGGGDAASGNSASSNMTPASTVSSATSTAYLNPNNNNNHASPHSVTINMQPSSSSHDPTNTPTDPTKVVLKSSVHNWSSKLLKPLTSTAATSVNPLRSDSNNHQQGSGGASSSSSGFGHNWDEEPMGEGTRRGMVPYNCLYVIGEGFVIGSGSGSGSGNGGGSGTV